MKTSSIRRSIYSVLLGTIVALSLPAAAHALGSQQNPQSGSTGLEATIPSPPPKVGATIALPVSGSTFNSVPITVRGICPDGLLVKLFSNDIFVGSVQCTDGSFSIQIDLFSGQNDLIARVYDSLDQPGPDSNKVSVTFNDAQFQKFGSHVSLTSKYAKLGANPGDKLTWPIVISGGLAPYAVSVDWGDGTAPEIVSQPFDGQMNITHVYKNAGTYKVIVRVSDTNGTTAFLQLVGVGNGKVTQANSGKQDGTQVITKKEFIWWPLLVIFPFIILSFWFGKRYELQSIHRQIEEQTKEYDNQ